MTLRLFAGISIPQHLWLDLENLQRGLDGAKWRPPENFHITLSFFGDMSPVEAEDLDAELAQIALPPFSLRLKDIGQFGYNDPHAVWAGVAPNETLTDLSKACRRTAGRMKRPKDKHPFRPHVTLAYLNRTSAEQVVAYAKRFSMFESSAFDVTSFSLFSSHPGKSINYYVEEARYPLFS